MTQKMQLLLDWLKTQLPHTDVNLRPLKGDASFRRYFRLTTPDKNYIAVDSPPATENNEAFVKISQAYLNLGLRVPEVISYDLEQGFLLLTDLGDNVLFQLLNSDNADNYYKKSLIELDKIQNCDLALPHFDANFMGIELKNFQDWLLDKHLNIKLTPITHRVIQKTFDVLLHSATSQPQCSIHRDYHSRNLMVLDNENIGILDFQDAMTGPITYDLVSLIRDCYIDWPQEKVMEWALFFHDTFLKKKLPSQEQFCRYLDLMGIQRHLKASFIFARKYHRDSVDHYLKDIPRTLNYIVTVSDNYAELRDFKSFIEDSAL
jgi:aminoglycoside/choline kinase family phosphotransferase